MHLHDAPTMLSSEAIFLIFRFLKSIAQVLPVIEHSLCQMQCFADPENICESLVVCNEDA